MPAQRLHQRRPVLEAVRPAKKVEDRMGLGQRRMVIREVRDPDERRRYLICRCEEEQ